SVQREMSIASEKLDAQIVSKEHIYLPQSNLFRRNCKAADAIRQPLRVTVNKLFREDSRCRKDHLNGDSEDLNCEFDHLSLGQKKSKAQFFLCNPLKSGPMISTRLRYHKLLCPVRGGA